MQEHSRQADRLSVLQNEKSNVHYEQTATILASMLPGDKVSTSFYEKVPRKDRKIGIRWIYALR
jgi:hypothetical protein